MFSAISAYANLLHGLYFAGDLGLSTWGVARPFLLSGVLPVLVVYLSEIVSSDVQHAVKLAERERRKADARASSTEGADAFPYPIEQAREILADRRALSKAEVLDTMLDIWRAEPDVGMTELATRVGRSRSTLYTYLDELEGAGRIARNGSGVEVT